MSDMEKFFNIYHYCIFILLNKIHLFVNKIDIVLLFFKIPCFKERLKKKNLDLVKIDEEYWMDKENGLNIWGASGILGSTITFVLLSLFLIFTKGYNIDNMLWPVAIVFIVMAIFIVLKYVSNDDKYLQYFDEFENWSKGEKIKYMLLSILIILGTIILSFASLFFHFSSGIFRNL